MINARLAVPGLLVCLLLGLSTPGCGNGDGLQASTSDEDNVPTSDSRSDDDKTTSASESKSGKKEEKTPGSTDDENAETAVPVDVAALQRGPIESILRFSSNLETEQQVQVFSQAKRLVQRLMVEEGDTIRKGQLLLRLQDEEQRSALAKVKSQLDKADREYRRQKELREQDLISQQVFADAIFELEQLQISYADSQRELSYTEVRAPISGTVTQRLVNVGDQVQIGQHLFDIVDFDSIVARVFVPEKYLPQLRPGLDARISTAAGSTSFAGRVDRISPVVDPQSGTVKVTIAIGNQKGLRPGLYVDVDLITATHADALLVPKRAVVYDRDQMFVYRLRDDRRVERVFFGPVLANKDFIEPDAGLATGDRVVVAGQAGLKENALVQLPENVPAPAAADTETEAAQRAST